jgi:serine protease Do
MVAKTAMPTWPGEVPELGLTLASAAKLTGTAKGGLLVTKIDPNVTAAERGIKENDLILDVAGRSVANMKDVYAAINSVCVPTISAWPLRVERVVKA